MGHFAYNVVGRHYQGGACTVILKVTIHDNIIIQIKIIKDKRWVGKKFRSDMKNAKSLDLIP